MTSASRQVVLTNHLTSMDVVLTAMCNLACSYCFQNARTARRMSWNTLRAAIDLLLASQRNEVELTFYGGEPLLEFEQIRRSVEYVEAIRDSGPSVSFGIITNGTLLGDRELEFLVQHDLSTQLSFDGTSAAQELRGESTFDILDRLLGRMRQSSLHWFRDHLQISMTVLPETVPLLAEGVHYLLGKGIRNIILSPLITDISDWKLDQIAELESEFDAILEMSLENFRKRKEVPVVLFRERQVHQCKPPNSRALCGMDRGETLTVDVDGQVYGCVMFAESYQTLSSPLLSGQITSLKLGDLRAVELEQRLAAFPAAVRQTKLFDHLEEKFSSYGKCSDCGYLGSCEICPVAIAHIPNNKDPRRIPDFLCAFNLVISKYRERFQAMCDRRDWLTNPFRAQELLREVLGAAN